MYFSFVSFILFATSVRALEVFTNADNFDELFGRGISLTARQVYAPNTTSCGQGTTCVIACGADQVECPSPNQNVMYCHSNADGSTCCPSGISCRAGYYCSSTNTYCCPNGASAAECALGYASVMSSIHVSSAVATSSGFVQVLSASSTPTPSSTSASSGFYNATASAPLIPQFTGDSTKIKVSEIAIFLGGASVFFLL